MGLAPSLSITDNMLLKNYGRDKGPLVDRKLGRADAQRVIRQLGVVTPSTETPVRRLSGGNVQKVLLGREIKAGPNVIITAYPVRGLDINSSYAIYHILNQQKKDGVGILFVGEDLDVMMALCDKIMVLCHGRIMGVVHAHKTCKEELGLMMTGALDLCHKYEDKPAGIAGTPTFPRAWSWSSSGSRKGRRTMRFHIVKRDSCPFWKKLCLYLAAVAAALVLGGLLLLVMGVDPIAYYSRMFTMGMVGNKIAYKAFENYLKVFVPLAVTAVALSLAFKMRFWNIGGRDSSSWGPWPPPPWPSRPGPCCPSR